MPTCFSCYNIHCEEVLHGCVLICQQLTENKKPWVFFQVSLSSLYTSWLNSWMTWKEFNDYTFPSSSFYSEPYNIDGYRFTWDKCLCHASCLLLRVNGIVRGVFHSSHATSHIRICYCNTSALFHNLSEAVHCCCNCYLLPRPSHCPVFDHFL